MSEDIASSSVTHAVKAAPTEKDGKVRKRKKNRSKNSDTATIDPEGSLEIPIQRKLDDRTLYAQKTKADLKEFLNEQKNNGLIEQKEVAELVSKWKRREDRRQKRATGREFDRACYNCRKPGHMVADCPETVSDMDYGTGICFKCGSTEHRIKECKVKTQGFPYAKCFVCNRTGHLSRDCDENSKGIYPKGGSCNLCGDISHLKKECPQLTGGDSEVPRITTLPSMAKDTMKSVDDDDTNCIDHDRTKPVKPKKTKIVKF